MEKIFEQVLLYDFYGELLTEHQRSIYEDAVCNDMSLGEIAIERGISRQGVHDLIKRCDRILQGYEGKLHLVERFARAKGKIGEIVELTEEAGSIPVSCAVGKSGNGLAAAEDEDMVTAGDKTMALLQQRMQRIRELSEQLMQEL